jgi:hypothetical protein
VASIYVVEKTGSHLTVTGGPRMTTDTLVAHGDAATGHVEGEVLYDPCSYCRDEWSRKLRTLYKMRGELRYQAGRLSFDARYEGGWINGRIWSGSLELSTAARRETANAFDGKLDGRPELWEATFVEDVAGSRSITLPRYLGDLPVWRNGQNTGATLGCARRPVTVSLEGAVLRVGSNEIHVPNWFSGAP